MTLIADTPIEPLAPAAPGAMLTIREYAESVGKSIKTVKRWLADGELPTAQQDHRGWWLIPAGATQVFKERAPSTDAPSTELVHMPRSRGTVELTPLTSTLPPELSPELIGYLPTFLTLDQAAYLLDLPAPTISRQRDYFHVVKMNRRLTVPLYRIKELRGLTR